MKLTKPSGFLQPAEWEPHAACWVAWPSAEDLWLENLAPARQAWTAMARAIGEGERLEVLVPDDAQESLAKDALAGVDARFHRVPFGDIWLRDTAPIFLEGPEGAPATVRFAFNGWGGKYVLDHDDRVAESIAELAAGDAFAMPFVLEGGAVDVDGEGTVLTTRQCLLNPNRNPSMSQHEVEHALIDSLGGEKILWLGDGLLNDHTDGHVDTVARFAGPALVVAMEPRSADDPHRDALRPLLRELD
jgi:agmatine deiminase